MTQQPAAFDSGWPIGDLLRPQAYSHPSSALELRETHISWVILTGAFAYKVKKPLKLGFIDASTLDRRRYYCEEELRLNHRLAPALYLEIVAVTLDDQHAVIGGRGPIVDYAVKMRQFPADDELRNLLAKNRVGTAEIVGLAESLAAFHSAATPAPQQDAEPRLEQLRDTVLGNLAELGAQLKTAAPFTSLSQMMHWTCDSLRVLEYVFVERERTARVRECHGDLHVANIVRIDGRLTPFDCIEFDAQLRWIDVMNDMAFLVMDLASRQRSDLAFVLLSRYLEITGDYGGISVLPFYAAYRALVRAKVDLLSADQQPAHAEAFQQRLQQRIVAARSWTTLPSPLLVLMHGPSGSGKSWLAERLIPELHAVRIRSDLERKRQAGIAASSSASAGMHEGLYSQEFSHRTYSHLTDCAEVCLRAGISTIVDAAFLEQSDREMFRSLAAQLDVTCIIVACEADQAVLATRVQERSRRQNDPSDATLTVLNAQLRDMRPFGWNEQRYVVHIDTNETDAVRLAAAAIAQKRASCGVDTPVD